MSETRTSAWWKSPAVGISLLGAVVAGVAALVLHKTTKDPAELTIFLGRFHPLVVHLPIGALMLIMLLEGATLLPQFRNRVDAALTIALPASVLFAAMAFVLGLLLARGGDYSASTVAWHRGLTLGAIGALAATSVAYTAMVGSGAGKRMIYRGLLGTTMGVLTVGAHFGGNLSRGGDYLTQYAPAPVRKLLGLTDAKAADSSAPAAGAERLVYADVVAPILTRTCVECHGPTKQKAKLRLDSLDAILKGGESGAAAVAGDGVKSPLYARLVLPESSDDHMPPTDHPAPTEAERELLRWWIDRGANDTLRISDALPPPSSRSLLEGAIISGTAPAPVASTTAAPTASASASATAALPDASSSSSVTAPPPVPIPIPHPAADGLVYRDLVAPILNARCTSCHGSTKQKGKLRLDSLAAMTAGGANGPAFEPGSSASSLLVKRMRLPTSSDDHMPPPKAAQPSDSEIEAIAFFVDHGAKEDLAISALPPNLRGTPAPPTPPTWTAVPIPPHPTTGSSGGAPATAEPLPSVSVAVVPEPPPRALPETLHWERDVILPLLGEKCGKCHTGEKAMSDFRVDESAALHKGGMGGPSFIAHHPEVSLIVHRLEVTLSDDDHMPPPDKPQMTPGQLELVSAWIKAGGDDGAFKPAALSAHARSAIGDIVGTSGPALPPPSTSAVASATPVPSASASTNPKAPPVVRGGSCAACAIGGMTDGALPAAALAALILAAMSRRAGRKR